MITPVVTGSPARRSSSDTSPCHARHDVEDAPPWPRGARGRRAFPRYLIAKATVVVGAVVLEPTPLASPCRRRGTRPLAGVDLVLGLERPEPARSRRGRVRGPADCRRVVYLVRACRTCADGSASTIGETSSRQKDSSKPVNLRPTRSLATFSAERSSTRRLDDAKGWDHRRHTEADSDIPPRSCPSAAP